MLTADALMDRHRPTVCRWVGEVVARMGLGRWTFPGRNRQRELLRYGSVGISLLALEYLIYLLGLHIGLVSPVAWNILARLMGGLAGYLLHCTFSFRDGVHSPDKLIRYFGLLLFNTSLSTALLAWVGHYLPSLSAKIISDVVLALISYLGARLIFKPKL
jgi:putative flippase GtrA